MRFAIVTIDKYFPILSSFIETGWQPIKLFTAHSEQRFGDPRQVVALAGTLGIPVQFTRITRDDLVALRDDGCEILIVAGYRWLIPDPEGILPYAINFHPSPLPVGRGPYPLPRAILDNHAAWAVSCHKLTAEFDAGPVIGQKWFAIDPDETLESLEIKTQFSGRQLASDIAAHFDLRWSQATHQERASYWPFLTEIDRIIDFSWPVSRILRHVRAVGGLESFAHLGGHSWAIRRAVGWKESHNWAPGQVLDFYHSQMTIAASDGIIALTDFSLLPPSASTRAS
jgi:methionyl-tRNA formyltransferase